MNRTFGASTNFWARATALELMSAATISLAVPASLYVFSYFHRVAPAVVATDLMRTFAITASSLAMLAAIYPYVFVAMALIAGSLADTLGPRWTMTLGAVTMGLGAALFGAEMLIRRVDWRVDPADESAEAETVALFVQECATCGAPAQWYTADGASSATRSRTASLHLGSSGGVEEGRARLRRAAAGLESGFQPHQIFVQTALRISTDDGQHAVRERACHQHRPCPGRPVIDSRPQYAARKKRDHARTHAKIDRKQENPDRAV